MSTKSTIALLGVLAALCVGYWAMLWAEDQAFESEVEKRQLFDFPPEAVQSLSLQVEEARATVGTREPGQPWKIIEPYTLEAYQDVWNRVVMNFADLFSERAIEADPEDLSQYELDEPRLTVDATTTEGREIHVIFGKMGPMQVNRYAQLNGGDVILIPNQQFKELNRALKELRQRYIFSWGKEGITRLEFSRYWHGTSDDSVKVPEGLEIGDELMPVVMELDDSGKWQLVEPVKCRANQDLVERLVSLVQFAAGEEYVDEPEDLGDYKLDPPGARITVRSGKDSEPQTVYLGGATRTGDEPKIFAKRAEYPAVFQVGAELIGVLPRTPDAFRESRLLSRKATDLRRIDYEAGEARIALEHAANQGWVLPDSEEKKTDQVAVSNFIRSLLELRGVSFPSISPRRAGLEEPIIRIRLTFAEEDEAVVIAVGNLTEDNSHYYATLDTGVITTVPSEAIEGIIVDLFSFQPKELLEFKPARAQKVSLVMEGETYRFEKGRRWKIVEPEGKVWDNQDDMQALLQAVQKVKARALKIGKTPDDLKPYGLDSPAMAITVTTVNTDGAEETLGPLRIGAPSKEKSQERFAMAEGRPGVFRVKQKIVSDVREALRGVRDKE